MSRAPFKQIDVVRAVKGTRAAGVVVGRVEIDPNGRIIVIAADNDAGPKNPLDEWLDKKNARTT